MRGARSSPPHDPAGLGVDHEGNVDEACEPPPNEWTPVEGSMSQEVSNEEKSTSVLHGRL